MSDLQSRRARRRGLFAFILAFALGGAAVFHLAPSLSAHALDAGLDILLAVGGVGVLVLTFIEGLPPRR